MIIGIHYNIYVLRDVAQFGSAPALGFELDRCLRQIKRERKEFSGQNFKSLGA